MDRGLSDLDGVPPPIKKYNIYKDCTISILDTEYNRGLML